MSTVARHLGISRGLTTQTWLATDIAERYFGGKYRVWFATELDPQLNGSSSNPMTLYGELRKIIHMNDYNHSRIEQLRGRLTKWIWGSTLPNLTKADVITEIESAPVRAFRPAIWSIDLDTILIGRLMNVGQYPDEYLIRDLEQSEFEVVVG